MDKSNLEKFAKLANEIERRIFDGEVGRADFSMMANIFADFQLRIQELEDLHLKDEDGYRVAHLKFWKMEDRQPDSKRLIMIMFIDKLMGVRVVKTDENGQLSCVVSGGWFGYNDIYEWAYLDGGE